MKKYQLLARILSGMMLLLVISIMIADILIGPIPEEFPFTPIEVLLFAFLFMSLTGLIIAWRREILGGILTISGMLLFTLTNSLDSGYLRFNWVFAAIALAAALFLFSAYRKNKPPLQ
jgi:peptidoglycan/LPS O-acetylase OafA/YrhL